MWNHPGLRSPRWKAGSLGSLLVAGVLLLGACAAERPATGPFPRFAEFEDQEVRRVTFSGDLRFSTDSLSAVVRTRPSTCSFLFLPICLPVFDIGRTESHLDLAELAGDVNRIQLYHRDHGFYGARVEPDVAPVEDGVTVDFVIAPGRQSVLQELLITGTEGLIPPEELLDAIPLEEGQPFGRLDFLVSADTIRSRLLARGHAYADVLRNYGIDTIAGVAEVEYVAIPGPVVLVDTILIQGNDRLSEGTIRRQMALGEGDIVRAGQIAQSQRNLYNLGMVSFASVQLAPDTLQQEAAQEQATVLVQVVEAAQYAVDASVGFGTVDCVRTQGLWTNRNFLGGGRTLEVLGSLSRIGAGAPADLGFANRVCSDLGDAILGFDDLRLADRLDYRLVADFQQPGIFGTDNRVTLNLHTERISEAEAYIRESIGGRVSAVRDLAGGQTVLTTTGIVEQGRTIANPAILCVGFDTCTQDDLDLLTQRRWSNSLSFAAVRDGVIPIDPVTSRGYVLRGALDWASPEFGSDDRYLRFFGEGSYYHPLRRGWILAGNLRFGRFIRGTIGNLEDGYIPPERRFYAGGPNSVRGYARNALGPSVYVIPPASADTVRSASGGTQTVLGSLELRTPSPILSDLMRFAAFVDAGHLSIPGAELFDLGGIRVTPGVGLRIVTPVGPFRLDIAYNDYRPERGPLYEVDSAVGLVLLDPEYRPPRPDFLGRFRLQFALGQAF